MDKEIKYDELSLIGMELFRKNNETFYKSSLSPIMKKIFLAANKDERLDNAESEYYMKSGILPNKIFYIYSDNLAEANKFKLYDVVNFNGDICIWFYSINVMNMIDNDPVNTINEIYKVLIGVFRKNIINNSTINLDSFSLFINKENKIATVVMILRLLKFLHETYGVLDIDECKKTVIELFKNWVNKEVIDDILNNCDNKDYFRNREYLDSFLL